MRIIENVFHDKIVDIPFYLFIFPRSFNYIHSYVK